MKFLLKLVIVPALLVFVKAEFPLDIDNLDVTPYNTGSYRLPEDLDPIHFDVEITPYFDEPEEGHEPFTFDGIVTMTVRVCMFYCYYYFLKHSLNLINKKYESCLISRRLSEMTSEYSQFKKMCEKL